MQKNEPSFMNTARFSEGVPLDGATSDAGVCFEGSPENAEMRCQSADGEVGYKGCTVDGDCLDPECVGRARVRNSSHAAH